MVCATHIRKTMILALVTIAVMVMVPFSACAETHEVEVAVTFYYIDDVSIEFGSYYSEGYHPLVILLPSEVFFSNKVTFEDKRSGDDKRKVKIKISIDENVKDWKEKKYSGDYDWEGNPKGEKKYNKEYGTGVDTPYIATIYELYHKLGRDWVQDDYTKVGEEAQVFTLDGPYVEGEPASVILDDDLIHVSLDQGIDPDDL